MCACGCGKKKLRYDKQGRESKYLPGHNARNKNLKTQEEIMCACGCGEKKFRYDSCWREGRYLPGHFNRGKTLPQKGRPNPKIQGPNHWNWQGGKSEERRDRNSIENNTWRIRVFERDNYTCKLCWMSSYDGIRLNAHHIRPYKNYEELRLDVKNGITLCNECHIKTFGKEEEFVEIFSALVANGVNCGNARPSDVEGNPQPSLGVNTEEGSETRGRGYDLGELEPLRSKMVPCEQCGKMHKQYPCKLKMYARHFCSVKCHNEWNKKHGIMVINNPNRKPKTEVKCTWCGESIYLSPNQMHSKNYFCCLSHYWLWKKGKPPGYAGNSSTSALAERHEIVRTHQ